MSLDERMRTALQRSADAVAAPDLDEALEGTKRRVRRRRQRRASLVTLAIIAVAGLAGLAFTRVADEPTRVNLGPEPGSSTTLPPAPVTAACPDHYRFAYLPDGWSDAGPGQIAGPNGSAKLTVLASSSAPVVGQIELVGFKAFDRSSDGNIHEIRIDDSDGVAHTDPSCGGELAVVVTGLSLNDAAMIVSRVEPITSLADRQQFRAVWPSSDLDEIVATANSSGFNDPRSVASLFAQQFGWNNPSVTDAQPSEDGTNGAQLTVEGDAGEPRLAVDLLPVPATGYWAVSYASTFVSTDDFALSVSVTQDPSMPDAVSSSFGAAATAALVLKYGAQGVDLTTDQMPPEWQFEVGPHGDVPGALIIRWSDASGAVVALHATSLPPGDFAAS